jgi:hypothetical protein
MRLKLASAIVLGIVVWLTGLSSGMPVAQVASADGPIGGVDPTSGSLFQTFTFGFSGFQANTVLTFSILFPGATAFTTVDTPKPVVSDSTGQAVIRLGLPALLGYPSVTSPETAGPELAQLATLVKVIWGPPPGTGERFRFDACDKLSCVDLVGALIPVSAP